MSYYNGYSPTWSSFAAPGATSSMSTTTFTTSSLAPTPSGPATYTIQVGPKESPHQYVPHSVMADVGDLIVFQFYPRNHSVVQADYRAPCVPANGDYFYSGIKNDFNEVNGQVIGELPTWNMTVQTTEPQFFYCTAIGSCQLNGMVGAINPNSTMTWENQFNDALEYPYMVVPGGSIPAEGGGGGGSSDSDSSSSSSSSSSSTLSGGAIAGIVIGSVAFLGILAALFFLLGRNRVYQQWLTSQDGRTERTARWALFGSGAGKSEMGSSATGGGGGVPPPEPSPGLPFADYGRQTYSPPPAPPPGMYSPTPALQHGHGHWSWDGSHQMQMQQMQELQPQQPVGWQSTPLELDATTHRPK